MSGKTDLATIVFDVGNVLIEWDPRHIYRDLFDGDELLMEDFLANVCTTDWNVEQDRGRTWAEAVAVLTAERPDCAELIRAYDECWQKAVPGAIEGSVDLLRRLKAQGTPVYALTNFSAEKFAETRKRFDFFDLFDGIVVSAHERLIKPDPALYRVLFDRYGLDPRRTGFIDDSPANVATARELGMTAWRFVGPDRFEADLIAAGMLAA
jgi:2-haloacid dehalogenase